MRKAQRELALRIRDVGFLPEDDMHQRSRDSTPYELGHDATRYPIERILGMAELASSLRSDALAALRVGIADPDSAVRFWGASGILMRGREATAAARVELRKALDDSAASVRATAAEALSRYGNAEETAAALKTLAELA